jgi:hypothetical protein
MNGHARICLLLSAVAMVGVLTVFGRTSAFAQSAAAQSQEATPAQLRSFLLYGGAYQQIDASAAPCTGQCGVINQRTGSCTCPNGFVPLPSARILVDVGSGPDGATCGSFLYICAR